MLSQPTHKSHPPVMPGCYPGKPPVKIPEKVVPQVERLSTLNVKPAAPSDWDAYARMPLEVLEEARISQFVLEECVEETTRFSVEEQVAAMAVQEAISKWGAIMDKRFGVDDEVMTQIRNLKKKVDGMSMKVDVRDPDVRRGMCKAAPRVQFKSDDALKAQGRASEQIRSG